MPCIPVRLDVDYDSGVGTEDDDHNPPRITPRHLFDLAIGDDNLFHGDKQLVEIWKGFLIHNHRMAQPDGKWIVTAKGEEWIGKYSL